jgi:hypothetical protein
MTKALVSFGVGSDFEEMLAVATPSFEAFAGRHDYDPVIQPDLGQLTRPPSWHKVPTLLELLDDYDEVLWVDADAVIVDDTDDLEVPADAWQALACHRTNDGDVPSCGTWLLRRPMIPVLKEVWTMTEYLHHGWWEQRAIAELLGFEGNPLAHVRTTELYEHTYWLDNGWSVHCRDQLSVERPRVMQASMYPDRLATMREWESKRRVTA